MLSFILKNYLIDARIFFRPLLFNYAFLIDTWIHVKLILLKFETLSTLFMFWLATTSGDVVIYDKEHVFLITKHDLPLRLNNHTFFDLQRTISFFPLFFFDFLLLVFHDLPDRLSWWEASFKGVSTIWYLKARRQPVLIFKRFSLVLYN